MVVGRKLACLFATTAILSSQNLCLATGLRSMKPTMDTSPPSPAPEANTAPQRLIKLHAGVSDEYILGPGDVLSITDTTEDKPATATAPILPDGTVVISYTGVIKAAGRSLREMNDIVNEEAKKWYVNPQIMVNLAKQRPVQIYLLGELVHPGLYSAGGGQGAGEGASSSKDSADSSSGSGDEPTHDALGSMVGSNTLTVAAAIQMAGGLKESADVRHLRVSRLAPKTTFQVDLWKLMIDGDVSEDIVLQPGDVVYVPKGGTDFPVNDIGMLVNNRPKVRVIGAAKQPGLLAMAPDDDLLSALAKAGGFEEFANKKTVWLMRTNRDGTVSTEKVNMSKAYKDANSPARQKVHPGDVILVKRSPTRTAGIVTARVLPNVLSSAILSIFISRMNNTNSTR